MRTRCGCALTCMACEKGMYEDCLMGAEEDPRIVATEAFKDAVGDMITGQIAHVPRNTGRVHHVTLLVGAGIGMEIVELSRSIESLEKKHGIKIHLEDGKEKNIRDDSYYPLFSEIMMEAPAIDEQRPYKITQNNDWRGNGKQRARAGHKGKFNGRSR